MSMNNQGLGWRDQIESIIVQGSGINDPSFTAWNAAGNIYANEFATGKMYECWAYVHLNHDYKHGTELYVHVHYLNNNGAALAGNVQWNFDLTYAKRDSGAFAATSTVSAVQAVSTTQYTHQVAEVATGLTVADFETDGVLAVRLWRQYGAASDNYNDSLWAFKFDVHYQSDHFSTPSKASDFFDPFDGS